MASRFGKRKTPVDRYERSLRRRGLLRDLAICLLAFGLLWRVPSEEKQRVLSEFQSLYARNTPRTRPVATEHWKWIDKCIEFGTAMTEGAVATRNLHRTIMVEKRQPLLEYEKETDQVFDDTISPPRTGDHDYEVTLSIIHKRRAPGRVFVLDEPARLALAVPIHTVTVGMDRASQMATSLMDDTTSLKDQSLAATVNFANGVSQVWNQQGFGDWSFADVSAYEEEQRAAYARQAEEMLRQLSAPPAN